tara:strand:- start:946 stop:3087 length:2142 start_codon:yes stop_codon:yes gene_type:complete
MNQKLDLPCGKCGDMFKCDPHYAQDPKCPKCIAEELAKAHGKEEVKEIIKNAGKKKYEFRIDTEQQKLTAVMAQGEVFASQAGPDLMLTEFVENAFDAIKKKKVLNALPDALKKMNVESSLQELAYDKHNLPSIEFNEKYETLSNEKETFLKNLWNELCVIIKSQSKTPVTVIVEIDDDTRQVRIIDCGTGVQFPIHICEQPFVSLKTGEDYSTGKFGRGSQVFRAFCELMQFHSLRESPSQRELDELTESNRSLDPNSIKINFPHKYPGGEIDWNFTTNDYKKLSGNTETGTVVVLDLWKGDYYNTLTKHVKNLESRLQHHFGFGLDDMFNISLKIKHNNKEIDVTKMDFDELAKPENPTKIDQKFNLPDIELKDRLGNPCGKIEFHVYKTHRSYSHTYKAPFLIVNGRPLGDTPIHAIPELKGFSDIWKSSTIIGYVICDTVELNQMRTGLALNEARTPFFDSMKAASITLKSLNSQWKTELSSAQDKEMANDVIQRVSSYLSKKGIKFNFKNPLEKGIQKNPNEKSGDEATDEKVADHSGPNPGLIESPDGDPTQVGYKKRPGGEEGEEWDEDTIIVPHGSNKKDGDKMATTKVKRSLVRKGVRKVKRPKSGPALEFNVDEDSGNELSYFESDPPCVYIQSEHKAWKKISKKAKEQTNAEKFEKEKTDYLMERYLWEIINHETTFTGDDMDDKDRKDLFWTFYHDLLDTK